MSSEAAIRIERLGKIYRTDDRPFRHLADRALGRPLEKGFVALRDIDLVVEPGETVGIIGRNGSGKSTLLQIVSGLMEPTSGRVSTRGRAVGLLELGAGFDPEFTGRENALLSMQMYGSASHSTARLAAIEAFARIGTYFERPVREYSSGMFARLAFAVAAHVNADILVVDEILSVGDAAFQQKCMRFLRRFIADGGTLLLASHSEQDVRSLCRRALWLERGVVRALGPAAEVCSLYAAECADGETSGAKPDKAPAKAEAPRPAAPRRTSPLAGRAGDSRAPLSFDPDSWPVGGEGDRIDDVVLRDPDGRPAAVLRGGEEVELAVTCRTGAARPVVAFLVRNVLGRVVFGDDSGTTVAARAEPFTVRFRFRLPFLSTGNHAVEAYLLDAAADQPELLARALDNCIVTIQSPHVGGGMANVAPRFVSIATGGASAAADKVALYQLSLAGGETDAA